MSTDVLVKDLRDRRTSVTTVGLSLVVMTFFVLGIYSGMRTTFDDLTRDFPPELLAFMGGETTGGYVVAELFHLIAPATLVGYAVVAGSGATAGEEQRRTMGMLLGAPVSRTDVLLSKTAGLVAGVVATTAMFMLGAVVSSVVWDVGLEASKVAATSLHLALLALLFGLLALAVAAATGRPGTAGAVSGGLALACYLADSMLPLAGHERWAEITPWFYYAGSDPLTNGLHLGHLGLLAGLCLAALASAAWAFDRRDLRG